jgi:NAD(P)-dependent dehydrogenase (short-subunit alcohol dehydrogenase family)
MAQFNSKSTANEVASAYASSIENKVILTTGVSPGSLGAVYVQTLAAYSPKLLILAGRSETKLQQTADAIKAAFPNVSTRLLILDLADQKQIRKAGAEVLSYSENIDILMNNAGIMAAPYSTTKDGLEAQFGANHIGHFLFTTIILPKILATPHPRIVNVTSDGHRLSKLRFDDLDFSKGSKYDKWEAYGQAKSANMLFTVELAKRYGSQGLFSYSLHPGVIKTNLGDHLSQEDFEGLMQKDRDLGNYEAQNGDLVYRTPEQGTATHVYASFSPDIAGQNGAYLLDCRVAEPKEIRNNATDPDDAAKLWALSERIVATQN